MIKPRNTPILESSHDMKSLFDFTAEANKASDRLDRNLARRSAATTEMIGYDRANKAIQRDANNKAYQSIGDLQAKAYFNHQATADKSIVDLQNWVENYDGDKTSPEFLSGFGQRVGAIKSFNSQSQGLVDLIPEVKKRADLEEYNTGQIMDRVQKLIDDPTSVSSPFSNINEEIENIFYEGLDENMIIKKALKSEYGLRDINRSYTDAQGGSSNTQYKLESVFDFDRKGNLIANRNEIDVDRWKEKYPEVVKKIRDELNDPDTVPHWVKSASTMTEDDMIREEIARRMEQLGSGKLSTNIVKASEYDKARTNKEQALAEKAGKQSDPIDYNSQYNKYVQGLLTNKYADAGQAIAKQDKQDLKFVTKKEFISKVNAKKNSGKVTKREAESIINQYSKYGDNDYIALKAGSQVYPPTQDGIKQSFISLGSENFSTRDDRVNLSTAQLSLDDRVDRSLLDPITNKDGGLQETETWPMIKEILGSSSKAKDDQGGDASDNSEKVITLQQVRSQYGDDADEAIEILREQGWTINE